MKHKYFTVAKSFCDSPLFCRPCWISLPSSSGIWSCFSSSVSRSNLAVFFVVTCCLFAPPPPSHTKYKSKYWTKKIQTNWRWHFSLSNSGITFSVSKLLYFQSNITRKNYRSNSFKISLLYICRNKKVVKNLV